MAAGSPGAGAAAMGRLLAKRFCDRLERENGPEKTDQDQRRRMQTARPRARQAGVSEGLATKTGRHSKTAPLTASADVAFDCFFHPLFAGNRVACGRGEVASKQSSASEWKKNNWYVYGPLNKYLDEFFHSKTQNQDHLMPYVLGRRAKDGERLQGVEHQTAGLCLRYQLIPI